MKTHVDSQRPLPGEKRFQWILSAAATASAAMATYHFLLPHIFMWTRFVKQVPSPIRWGIFSINFFFSALLLLASLATLLSIRTARTEPRSAQTSLVVLSMFWFLDFVYQIFLPFPTPTVRWVLLAFAGVVAVLYIAALVVFPYQRAAGPATAPEPVGQRG